MSASFGRSPQVVVTAEERAEYVAAACDIAKAAGRLTLPFFRSDLKVDNKLQDGEFDPVTEADRIAEAHIRAALRERFPEHGLYGEEYGYESGNGLTWVIDPIDGTRAFMSGMVHWGVLMALYDGERPIVGVMCQPFVDELFWGDCHSAFYQRGDAEPAPMRTSSVPTLDAAILTTTGAYLLETQAQRDAFDRLSRDVKLTRTGGDCYVYAMLALGQVELATDGQLNPYDIQALIPIIEGAGGVVSRLDGEDPAMGGWVLASANPQLHAQALRSLGKVGAAL
ncbi:MAG: inositol monophosphatase family protein [Pseudomonadales bacterium]